MPDEYLSSNKCCWAQESRLGAKRHVLQCQQTLLIMQARNRTTTKAVDYTKLHDVLFLEHMPNFQGPLGMPSILLTLNSTHKNTSLEISDYKRKPCLKSCNHGYWAIVTSAIHKHTHGGCRGTLHTL